MTQFDMVDAVPQIRALLEAAETEIEYSVSATWPRRTPSGNLVTVQEIANNSTGNPCVDVLGYQIDLWSDSQDAIRWLTPALDRQLTGIGLRRNYSGPILRQGDTHYRKTLRYGRRVDKRFMRLID